MRRQQCQDPLVPQVQITESRKLSCYVDLVVKDLHLHVFLEASAQAAFEGIGKTTALVGKFSFHAVGRNDWLSPVLTGPGMVGRSGLLVPECRNAAFQAHTAHLHG